MTEKPDPTKKYVSKARRTISNNIQAGQKVSSEQPVDSVKKTERTERSQPKPTNISQNKTSARLKQI